MSLHRLRKPSFLKAFNKSGDTKRLLVEDSADGSSIADMSYEPPPAFASTTTSSSRTTTTATVSNQVDQGAAEPRVGSFQAEEDFSVFLKNQREEMSSFAIASDSIRDGSSSLAPPSITNINVQDTDASQKDIANVYEKPGRSEDNEAAFDSAKKPKFGFLINGVAKKITNLRGSDANGEHSERGTEGSEADDADDSERAQEKKSRKLFFLPGKGGKPNQNEKSPSHDDSGLNRGNVSGDDEDGLGRRRRHSIGVTDIKNSLKTLQSSFQKQGKSYAECDMSYISEEDALASFESGDEVESEQDSADNDMVFGPNAFAQEGTIDEVGTKMPPQLDIAAIAQKSAVQLNERQPAGQTLKASDSFSSDSQVMMSAGSISGFINTDSGSRPRSLDNLDQDSLASKSMHASGSNNNSSTKPRERTLPGMDVLSKTVHRNFSFLGKDRRAAEAESKQTKTTVAPRIENPPLEAAVTQVAESEDTDAFAQMTFGTVVPVLSGSAPDFDFEKDLSATEGDDEVEDDNNKGEQEQENEVNIEEKEREIPVKTKSDDRAENSKTRSAEMLREPSMIFPSDLPSSSAKLDLYSSMNSSGDSFAESQPKAEKEKTEKSSKSSKRSSRSSRRSGKESKRRSPETKESDSRRKLKDRGLSFDSAVGPSVPKSMEEQSKKTLLALDEPPLKNHGKKPALAPGEPSSNSAVKRGATSSKPKKESRRSSSKSTEKTRRRQKRRYSGSSTMERKTTNSIKRGLVRDDSKLLFLSSDDEDDEDETPLAPVGVSLARKNEEVASSSKKGSTKNKLRLNELKEPKEYKKGSNERDVEKRLESIKLNPDFDFNEFVTVDDVPFFSVVNRERLASADADDVEENALSAGNRDEYLRLSSELAKSTSLLSEARMEVLRLERRCEDLRDKLALLEDT